MLIMESDNLMLVQYVNGFPEPNEITRCKLKDISDLLKHITCAVFHVYEEANEAARNWAVRDECPNSAKAAQSLNCKFEIADRTVEVSSVTEHVGIEDAGAKTADFDDDGGGLALNALFRAIFMAKRNRISVASGVVGTLGVPAAAPAQPEMSMPMGGATAFPNMLPTQVFASMVPKPIGIPSKYLLLKNMFDPATEMDPEYDLDIKDEVKVECSKYGRVKHIHVDRNSAGYVYLQFDSVEAASRAQQAMHKRWFAGRSISAIFLQPCEYDAKFKGTG